MTDAQFRQLIEQSEYFLKQEKFKKSITLRITNLRRLDGYYHQANKYGIDYLRQNPNLTVSDVTIINSIL